MASFIDLDSFWRDRDIYPNPCQYELTPNQVALWTVSAREVRAIPQNPNSRPLDFVDAISVISASLPYPRVELFAPSTLHLISVISNTFTADGTVALNDIIMTSSPGFGNSIGLARNVEYHVINLAGNTFQLSLTQGGAAVTFTDSTGIGLEVAVISPADYTDVIEATESAIKLAALPRIYLDFHCKLYPDTRLLNTNNGVLQDAKFVLGIDRIQFDDNATPVWIHYKAHGEQVMRFKRNEPVTIRFMTRDGTTIPFFEEEDMTIVTNPNKQSLITLSVTPYLRDGDYANHLTDPIA
jgi:hypothetical protein